MSETSSKNDKSRNTKKNGLGVSFKDIIGSPSRSMLNDKSVVFVKERYIETLEDAMKEQERINNEVEQSMFHLGLDENYESIDPDK